jgi:three-Cys-motif partner protein
MNLSRERVCLIFMEKRRDRFEHLCAELTRQFGPLPDLPVHVKPCLGEAGKDLEPLLGRLGAWDHPILAVLDSWGNVNVPFSLLSRIAHNSSSEAITTFGPNWFNRREEENPEQLDVVFGGRSYWQPADRESRSDERWRAWLATFRDAQRRAGFRHQLQFEIVPRTGQPLYLVFGTGHPRGVEVMKAAMWDVDARDGMRFRDPRTRGAVATGQQALWGGTGAVDPELLELVEQRLKEPDSVSLEQLGNWLLLETARWRAPNASAAVKELVSTGQVRVAPRGRLTKASLISWR